MIPGPFAVPPSRPPAYHAGTPPIPPSHRMSETNALDSPDTRRKVYAAYRA